MRGEMAAQPFRELGERLEALVTKRGMSGREFGRQLQVSDSYPSKLFAGANRPDVDLLKRMAQFLGADYEELAHLAGYRDRPSDVSPFIGALRTLEDSLDERAKELILAMAIHELTRLQRTAVERAPTALPARDTSSPTRPASGSRRAELDDVEPEDRAAAGEFLREQAGEPRSGNTSQSLERRGRRRTE